MKTIAAKTIFFLKKKWKKNFSCLPFVPFPPCLSFVFLLLSCLVFSWIALCCVMLFYVMLSFGFWLGPGLVDLGPWVLVVVFDFGLDSGLFLVSFLFCVGLVVRRWSMVLVVIKVINSHNFSCHFLCSLVTCKMLLMKTTHPSWGLVLSCLAFSCLAMLCLILSLL